MARRVRIDPLDTLFSLYIRTRDKWTCQRCWKYKGKAQGLDCAHFHSRKKKSVRWDEDNACALCCGCHTHLDGNPKEKVAFFEGRLGDRAVLLDVRAYKPCKPDKKLIELWLKQELNKLENRVEFDQPISVEDGEKFRVSCEIREGNLIKANIKKLEEAC